MTFSFKQTLTALAVITSSLALTAPVMAKDFDVQKLKRIERDMQIMGNILKTSLNENNDRRTQSRIEGIYLAGQGFLYNIQPRGGYQFNFKEFYPQVMPVAPKDPKDPKAPKAPKAPVNPIVISEVSPESIEMFEMNIIESVEAAIELAEVSVDFISDSDWSHASSKARAEQRHIHKELRTEQRNLERQARVLEQKVRNIERRIRDAEFEEDIQQGEQDKKKLADLKKEMEMVTKEMSAVAHKIQEKAEVIRKRAHEFKEKQLKKQKQKLAQTEQLISQTVCDFGGGLRSLPNNEHITFNVEGNNDNQIYVFSKKDILSCNDGKINATQLLDKATKYAI